MNTTIIKGLLEKSLSSLGEDFHPSCEVFAYRFYSELVAASIAGDKTIPKVKPVSSEKQIGKFTCGACGETRDKNTNGQKYCDKTQNKKCKREMARRWQAEYYERLKKNKNAVPKS